MDIEKIEEIENALEDLRLELHGGTINIIDKKFNFNKMVNKLNTFEEIRKHIKENDRNIEELDNEFIDKWRKYLETRNDILCFCEMMRQLVSLSDIIFHFSYKLDKMPSAYEIKLDSYDYHLNIYKTHISNEYTNSDDIKKEYGIDQDYIYITCIEGYYSSPSIKFISTSENFYDVFLVKINNEYVINFDLIDMVKIMYTSLSEDDIISRIKKIDEYNNWFSEMALETYSNYVENYREYLDPDEY